MEREKGLMLCKVVGKEVEKSINLDSVTDDVYDAITSMVEDTARSSGWRIERSETVKDNIMDKYWKFGVDIQKRVAKEKYDALRKDHCYNCPYWDNQRNVNNECDGKCHFKSPSGQPMCQFEALAKLWGTDCGGIQGMTVEELIKELEKYPKDAVVEYDSELERDFVRAVTISTSDGRESVVIS